MSDLKSMLSLVPVIPVLVNGGIRLQNMQQYLTLPNLVCVGGSGAASGERIREAGWAGITRVAELAVQTARPGLQT